MAYRPDDLILCNTNNGTERLNEDRKYDELDDYKNCSLSELLSVFIDSFIPKHYNKYVELNVRYGDGCKKYSPGIPYFLWNRPKQIFDILLDKMQRATDDISITKIDNFTFPATSFEEGTRVRKNYRTFLSTKNKFCTCNCYNFKQWRMLCKHFFAVFQSGLAKFDDLTKLFKDHPYMVLDTQLLLGKHNILSEKCNTHVDLSNDHNTGSEKIDHLEKGESSESSIESSYCELPLKRSAIKIKETNTRGHLKQLIDLTCTTSDLKVIEELESHVKKLFQYFTQKITQGEINDFPQSNAGHLKPPAKKKKHPYSGCVGQTADMMLQFHREKLELPLEEESNIILESVIEEDNLQLYNFKSHRNFSSPRCQR